MLLEKDKLLSKQKDLAAIFNKHFGSITDWLNLFSWREDTSFNVIIKKFAFHRRIKAMKRKLKIKFEFSFNNVSSETINRIINEYV